MRLFKQNNENKKLKQINFFNKPYLSYYSKKLTDKVEILYNQLNDIIGTISELDPLTNDGLLMELYFADCLDSNNLHYHYVEQGLSFFSKMISSYSQRCDFIISNNNHHYFIDVKLQKTHDSHFTLNLTHLKHYSYFNTNIGDLYLVFFKKNKITYNSCFILKWNDLEQHLKINPVPSFCTLYYKIPNILLNEVKLNELNQFFC